MYLFCRMKFTTSSFNKASSMRLDLAMATISSIWIKTDAVLQPAPMLKYVTCKTEVQIGIHNFLSHFIITKRNNHGNTYRDNYLIVRYVNRYYTTYQESRYLSISKDEWIYAIIFVLMQYKVDGPSMYIVYTTYLSPKSIQIVGSLLLKLLFM